MARSGSKSAIVHIVRKLDQRGMPPLVLYESLSLKRPEHQSSPPGLGRSHLVHGRETLVMSPSGLLHDGGHLTRLMRPLAQRNNILA